jgi:uncharacterized protein DUF1259
MNRLVTWVGRVSTFALCVSSAAAEIDWSAVDQGLGRKGSELAGGVHKYGLPCSDLHITVDGGAIRPALALGSWLAFQPSGDGAMVMGDLVLTDAEISPVMQRLSEGDIEITAIHNHLLRSSVPVLYMHVAAHGDPVKLAQVLRAGLALSNTPLSSAPPPAATATASTESRLLPSTAIGSMTHGICSSRTSGRMTTRSVSHERRVPRLTRRI